MPKYNDKLTPGNYREGEINTVVEIPLGSTHKIEWDRESGMFVLDRVEPKIFAKPVNYGFIPGTLDEDGDELDSLIVTEEPLPTALVVNAKVVGILNFEDGGEIDHKVVCVPNDDRNTADGVNSLDDLGEGWKRQIEHHFSHYKDLKKPGSTKVLGWGDAAEAIKTIENTVQAFKNK